MRGLDADRGNWLSSVPDICSWTMDVLPVLRRPWRHGGTDRSPLLVAEDSVVAVVIVDDERGVDDEEEVVVTVEEVEKEDDVDPLSDE